MSNENLGSGLPAEPVKAKKAAKAPKAPKAAATAAPAPAKAAKAARIVDVNGMIFDLDKRYRIEIDEAEGQPNYETVSVNGVCHQIKRGVVTSVRAEVAIALCRAIAARLVKVGENQGKPEYELRDYHAIPFRIMGEG